MTTRNRNNRSIVAEVAVIDNLTRTQSTIIDDIVNRTEILTTVPKTVDLVDRSVTVVSPEVEKLDQIISAALEATEVVPDLILPEGVNAEKDETLFFMNSSPDSFMYAIEGHSLYSADLDPSSPRPYVGTVFAVSTEEGRKLKQPIANLTLNGLKILNDPLSVKLFALIGKDAKDIGKKFDHKVFRKEFEAKYCFSAILAAQKARIAAKAKREEMNAKFKKISIKREDLAEFF